MVSLSTHTCNILLTDTYISWTEIAIITKLKKLRENAYSVGIAESLLLFINAPINAVHIILEILRIMSSRECLEILLRLGI